MLAGDDSVDDRLGLALGFRLEDLAFLFDLARVDLLAAREARVERRRVHAHVLLDVVRTGAAELDQHADLAVVMNVVGDVAAERGGARARGYTSCRTNVELPQREEANPPQTDRRATGLRSAQDVDKVSRDSQKRICF